MLNRLLVVFIGLAFTLALLAGGPAACGNEPNVHDTKQALENDCILCHQSAYVAASNPKHQDAFPDTCHDCHTTELWSPLDKAAGDTIHELDAVKKLECKGCHLDEYEKTTTPKHAPLYPTDCKDCHSTKDYRPLGKDIHTTATFATKTCYDCHEDKYESAVPDHTDAAFPKAGCAGCHNIGSPTVKAWKPTKL